MAINKNDYLDVNGDYDLKKGLFDQLIDFLGDGGVEESGSNYVRFKDGTQICWTTASLSKVSNYYLSGYTAFPKSFINIICINTCMVQKCFDSRKSPEMAFVKVLPGLPGNCPSHHLNTGIDAYDVSKLLHEGNAVYPQMVVTNFCA